MAQRKDKKPAIVGGMFGLPSAAPKKGKLPGFLRGDHRLLANGRSCLNLVLTELSARKVWLPSYLCASVLEAVPKRTAVAFYEIDYNLTPSRLWLELIREGDVVVVINYFGLGASDTVAKAAKKRGATVVEDACQGMMANLSKRYCDFAIFSPRKFVGVPDGGVLQVNVAGRFTGKTKLQSPASDWWSDSMLACSLRSEFDEANGGDRHWFELFQRAEAKQPAEGFAMSRFSRELLRTGFDWSDIATKRRRNFLQLASELGDVAVFKRLPARTVPLGFPIRSTQRDSIRKHLFKHQVYPPIHWPIAGVVPKRFKESHRLADEILTLPCDQRYSARTMAEVARLTREALRMR